jgi:Macrocin-O-methyltransferase (TylF)
MSHSWAETIRLRLSRVAGDLLPGSWPTIKAWIKLIIRGSRSGYAEQQRARQLLSGKHAPPTVLRTRETIYVAHRPDSDVVHSVYPEIGQLSELWTKGNEERNAGDLPRLYALVLNIRQVIEESISGDMAELGVFRGNSAAVLAHYARLHGRRVSLFDTFEGFDERDLVGEDKSKPMEFDATSLNVVRQLVGDESVRYVQGYFPESIPPDLREWRFCLAHIDCDLYEPAKAGLEFFYPRLMPGGLLIVHDYANPYWMGIKSAVDEFCRGIPERPVVLADKSGTVMIRKLAKPSIEGIQ